MICVTPRFLYHSVDFLSLILYDPLFIFKPRWLKRLRSPNSFSVWHHISGCLKYPYRGGKCQKCQGHNAYTQAPPPHQLSAHAACCIVGWTGRTWWCHLEGGWRTVLYEQGPLNMVSGLCIAPQSGFKSGHLSTLPLTTQIYTHTRTHTHNSPLQTLPWSPLWHFQVFTVVTNIEGKQQTEPLPVSASHWETIL